MVMWLHCFEEEGREGVCVWQSRTVHPFVVSGKEGGWRPSVAFKDRCQ